MDIILVADNFGKCVPVAEALAAAGHHAVKQIGVNEKAGGYVEALALDAMIVISDAIGAAILREMRTVIHRKPMPVVVLTGDASQKSIDAAVKAGVCAYVVDCADPGRIDSLLRVAKTRFNEQQQLYKELDSTRRELAERKQIEKAKGIIMNQKKLTEDQAYKAMRKLAMDRNRRIADIAEQIIAASEVLV